MTDLLEGKIMGIFGFHKSKKDKRAWALALYGKRLRNPEMVSEEELSVITTGMLMQHLRIIRESVSIIKKRITLIRGRGGSSSAENIFRMQKTFKHSVIKSNWKL